MEAYLEVLSRTLELSQTLLEGLEHINLLLEEMKYESAGSMLKEVMEGMEQIYFTMIDYQNKLGNHQLNTLYEKVMIGFNEMEQLFKENRGELGREKMSLKVIPLYQAWKAELHRVFSSFTLQ